MAWRWRRLANVLGRRRSEHELDDELRFHLEMEAEKNARRGLEPEEARRQALVALGGLEKTREEYRDAIGVRLLRDLGQDLRYALRQLRRSPAFSIVAVLSLGLGIGANTAIFTQVDAIFLRPPAAVAEPGRLVNVFHVSTRNGSFSSLSYPDYLDFQQSKTLDGLAAHTGVTLHLSTPAGSERVEGEMVSANYFEVLGVRPALGRAFLQEEGQALGSSPVAVISYGMWLRQFGGDRGALGKQLLLNGHPFTIIGVAPRGFRGTQLGEPPEVWAPLTMNAQLLPSPVKGWNMSAAFMKSRTTHWLDATGRLKPDAGIAQAEAELKVMAERIAQAERDPEWQWSVMVRPASRSKVWPGQAEALTRFLTILMAVVAMVLLVACSNVASLLLARATARQREIAVRLALGAARQRLVRQMLTESLLLALLGAGAGLLLGWAAARSLSGFALAADLPALPVTVFNGRVFLFTACLSLLTGLLAGLVPALQASRPNLVDSLKRNREHGRRGSLRVREFLVGGQIAVSLVLIIGSGLLLRTFLNERAIEPGFNTRNLLLVSFDVGKQGYDEARGRGFYTGAVQRVESLPGVRSASIAAVAPFSSQRWATDITVEGVAAATPAKRNVNLNICSPRYFQTLEIPLLAGREFDQRDREGAAPVAVVNEALARSAWPGGRAVGQHFRQGEESVEVVGVVRDSKYRNIREQIRACIYRPLAQQHVSSAAVLQVKTAGDPRALAVPVRKEIATLDARLPMFNVRTMEEQHALAFAESRAAALLVGCFSGLAVLLAVLGLYGVMSYLVTNRTSEIGIRIALGARRVDVSWMVLRRVLLLAGAGIAVGLAGATVLARLLASMLHGLLFGLNARDPLTLTVSVVLMLGVGALAGYLPARRAARVEPVVALRHE